MSDVAEVVRESGSLQDAALKEKLQELRRTDNYTNLLYLAATYVYLAVVIGGAIAFHYFCQAHGLSWWWEVPVMLLAVILVGAGQHRLAGLAHEASHHILLRNRYFNEFVSDWFCMFPLFSSTHHYRLQHLAHHQFVNDPDRDPDVSQLRTSGHWLNFPLSPRAALAALLRQVWLPGLIRYVLVRSRYGGMPQADNPYARKEVKPSRIPVRVGLAYILGLTLLLTVLVYHGNLWLLAVLPALCWAAVVTFYMLIPERLYQQLRVHLTISIRTMTVSRMTFTTLLFSALAWLTVLTGAWAAVWFALLWLLPIATSFSFFMILRQLVQHGNAGRGWLTNTRIFLVHRLIRWSVFPFGQDYHLPHHLFATVPHYRLAELHAALLQYPEYREHAVVVHGYFLPPHPTVLDVLGPDYAPTAQNSVHGVAQRG